jgi:uncharacterized protein YeaO (DUF488 family)
MLNRIRFHTRSSSVGEYGRRRSRGMMTTVKIKRVYDAPHLDDGTRILVDRLWPRGVKKEAVRADLWLKEIAPSPELRKWFGHDPERWPEFKAKYSEELRFKKEELSIIVRAASAGPVTLLYGARDESHNQAVVLQEMIGRL